MPKPKPANFSAGSEYAERVRQKGQRRQKGQNRQKRPPGSAGAGQQPPAGDLTSLAAPMTPQTVIARNSSSVHHGRSEEHMSTGETVPNLHLRRG